MQSDLLAGGLAGAQRILVILVAGIGDTVLGIPALRALRSGFPGAHIALLGRYPPLELLEDCPYVDERVSFDLARFKDPGWLLRPAGWWDLACALGPLRARRFDLAVNLYRVGTAGGALRMATLLGWVGVQVTAGRRSPFHLPRYRIVAEAAGHELESQLAVVHALGAPAAGAHLEFWIRPPHQETCAAFLEGHGIPPDARVVCLHPGSTKREARWPAAGFAAVADRLAAGGARLVITGGQEERPLAEAVAAASHAHPAIAAGVLGLGPLAALFQRAALLVTNDSGPMHVAAAAGCPLIGLFGPTDPRAFGPRGEPAVTRTLVVRHPRAFDEAAWLSALPPALVASEAEALLARAPGVARRGAQ